jgi:hypothetical protein
MNDSDKNLLRVGHVTEAGLGLFISGPFNDERILVGVLSDGLLRPLLSLLYEFYTR